MQIIKSYIIALTNLYGIIDKGRVIKIYNKQNDNKISDIIIDDDNNVHSGEIVISEAELEKCFIYIDDSHFVHEAVFEYDGGVGALIMAKAGKPYYIPKKKDLLKFTDPYYHEISDQYTTLYEYINKKMLKNNSKLASSLSYDIYISIQCGVSTQELFDLFSERDIEIKDFNQAQDLSYLIMELKNNTRIWENNGHTPSEIFELFEKQKLTPFSKPLFTTLSPKLTVIRGSKKIGRNGPCPCGSAKKYKNCCLDKDKN